MKNIFGLKTLNRDKIMSISSFKIKRKNQKSFIRLKTQIVYIMASLSK